MPGGASAITALEVVAAKYVKHIGDAQVSEFVGLALFVDEQGKSIPVSSWKIRA